MLVDTSDASRIIAEFGPRYKLFDTFCALFPPKFIRISNCMGGSGLDDTILFRNEFRIHTHIHDQM